MYNLLTEHYMLLTILSYTCLHYNYFTYLMCTLQQYSMYLKL